MLPQLEYATYPSQLFWLLVNIILLYWFVSCFIIPTLDGIIKKRTALLEHNQSKLLKNTAQIKVKNSDYAAAISKANHFAKDLTQDNNILKKEYEARIYKELADDIKALYIANSKQNSELKNNICLDLLNEVTVLIAIYYEEVMYEKIEEKKIFDDFGEQIKCELL